MTLCLAKGADLLLLDEPAAALDPVARSRLTSTLMRTVAEYETTVLLSSHAIVELENICDFVVILSQSRVQLTGGLDEIVCSHRLLTGARREPSSAPRGMFVVHASSTDRQSTWLVRISEPVSDPTWIVSEPTLSEIVLAYLQTEAALPVDLSQTLLNLHPEFLVR
jgi:ABC-2 type transport system ATP-binding protein